MKVDYIVNNTTKTAHKRVDGVQICHATLRSFTVFKTLNKKNYNALCSNCFEVGKE